MYVTDFLTILYIPLIRSTESDNRKLRVNELHQGQWCTNGKGRTQKSRKIVMTSIIDSKSLMFAGFFFTTDMVQDCLIHRKQKR